MQSEDKKGKVLLTIEPVPLYLHIKFEKEPAEFLKYCEEKYGLRNPVVKLMEIKKNALLVVDGFPMHLRGTSEKQLKLQGAVQLCLDMEEYRYYKKIEKYLERNAVRLDKRQPLKVRKEYDGITKEENMRLYHKMLKKHADTIYAKRPGSQVEKLELGKEKFAKLTEEEQSVVLGEILKLFRCRPIAGDLRKIGGSENAGVLVINKKISDKKCVIIKNQSITGLFEQVVDLKKL